MTEVNIQVPLGAAPPRAGDRVKVGGGKGRGGRNLVIVATADGIVAQDDPDYALNRSARRAARASRKKVRA